MPSTAPEILIVKTAALGDVLRTTSILEGLHERHPGARVTWVTAPSAVDLVRTHPLVHAVVPVATKAPVATKEAEGAPSSVAEVAKRLRATRWTRVVSLDDEEPLCKLVASLDASMVTGATLDATGKPAYTDDAAPWFDMGLLSRFGKAEADRRKLANTKSQPALYAEMLGIRMGKPRLVLTPAARAFGERFRERHGLESRRPLVGLNTGAGGRWASKQLSEERTVELAGEIARELHGRVAFVLLGGEAEAERNRRILAGLARWPAVLEVVDAGVENALLDFAAIVAGLDLLVTSDSLALHVAVANDVPVVAFFAPTSAAEIELYGRGEKVLSTAPDYCSYRPDADNATITVPRLATAVLRTLGRSAVRR